MDKNALDQAWQTFQQTLGNVKNFFDTGPELPFKSPIPKRDVLTHSLPAGVISPIPEKDIILHPMGPSAFQQAIEQVQQGVQQKMQQAKQYVSAQQPKMKVQVVPQVFTTQTMIPSITPQPTAILTPIQTQLGKIKGFTTTPVPQNLVAPITQAAQQNGINPAVLASILFSEHGFQTDQNKNPSYDEKGNFLGYDRGIAQINCVSLDTPILCADLQWRKAGNLKPGNKIIAFDENVPNPAFRTGEILLNGVTELNCYEIVTSKGKVVASENHKWLVKNDTCHKKRSFLWKTTDELKRDDKLVFFLEPWVDDFSYEDGWLAGIIDGEGCLANNEKSRCWSLSIAQTDGFVQDKIKEVLITRGYKVGIVNTDNSKRLGTKPAKRFDIHRRREIMKILGIIRPIRMIKKINLSDLWEGLEIIEPRTVDSIFIQSINFLGKQKVATIESSTKTLITAGFLTHNSYWHPEVTDEQAFDPNFAIPWAANLLGRYIKEVQAQGGTLAQGIAAYNVGVSGAMTNGAGKLGPKGQHYLSKITHGLDQETLKQLGLSE